METEFVTSYKIFVDDVWMVTLPISTSFILRSIMEAASESATITIIKTKTKVDKVESK